jgi:hypothetical protein
MTEDLKATVHLKMTAALRNCILGKLRGRGTTMQSFFVDIAQLIATDEALLELLEHKRNDLRERRELVHS